MLSYPMRSVQFESKSWEEFTEWQFNDAKIWKKVVELIDEARRNSFEGKGKPEALKHTYKGYWSRRITQEHRLVYKVFDDEIIIVACRGHY